ncbi:FadR/GntR family transcriptional regulator [Alloscardovia criceti]|uniref:FadR/GntR family transcriptional regulator n=1 Tax=Alloscardovia criceti TaxID=356828 RepID=UPI00036C086B|nr:FCD domain-containing protein [Alloscardovia criceti]
MVVPQDGGPNDAINVIGLRESLNAQFTEPSSTRRRVDITMDAIKSYIIHEGLQPGDPLPTESELCTHLKSARSSVREALRKLEALDIVSVVHGKGTFVGSLSLDPLVEALSFRAMIPQGNSYKNLRDVIEMRKILDQGMARQVVQEVQKLPESDIAHLRDLTQSMIAKAQDGETFLDEDISFHQGLMKPVDNAIAKQLMSSLWLVHMAVVPALNADISTDLMHSAQSHVDMLESILSGDIMRYLEAVDSHYQPIEYIIHKRMS